MGRRGGDTGRTTARALLAGLAALLLVSASVAAPPPLPPDRDRKPLPPRRDDREAPPRDEIFEIVPPTPASPIVVPRAYPSGSRYDESPKLRRTLDLSFSPYHRRLRLPGTLAPRSGDADDVAARGEVAETGFSIRGGGSIDGFRFGLGAGLSGPVGLRIVSASGRARSLDSGKAFGTPIEAFLGYAIGPTRGIRPFLELRASAALLHFAAAADGAPRERQTVVGASVGARVGVLVWINEYFFADVGVGLGFVGAERVMGSVGLGVPIPLANL